MQATFDILILERVGGLLDAGAHGAETRCEIFETGHALLRAGQIRPSEDLARRVVAPALAFASEVGLQIRHHARRLLSELLQLECRRAQLDRIDS
ncbi:hypothetical protein [Nocardia sp. NPDC002869]|uniref:hypothetical protein n=1 Tax=Nocardia sp. NPDC002869 TaxID=3161032 RepID=UPI00398D21A0